MVLNSILFQYSCVLSCVGVGVGVGGPNSAFEQTSVTILIQYFIVSTRRVVQDI